jgi:hypothetical protein
MHRRRGATRGMHASIIILIIVRARFGRMLAGMGF